MWHVDLYILICNDGGAHSSLVVKALGYKPEGRRFEPRWDEIKKIKNQILPAALDPGVYPASNKNGTFYPQKLVLTSPTSCGRYNLLADSGNEVCLFFFCFLALMVQFRQRSLNWYLTRFVVDDAI
jgi:hypothetical protein